MYSRGLLFTLVLDALIFSLESFYACRSNMLYTEDREELSGPEFTLSKKSKVSEAITLPVGLLMIPDHCPDDQYLIMNWLSTQATYYGSCLNRQHL